MEKGKRCGTGTPGSQPTHNATMILTHDVVSGTWWCQCTGDFVRQQTWVAWHCPLHLAAANRPSDVMISASMASWILTMPGHGQNHNHLRIGKNAFQQDHEGWWLYATHRDTHAFQKTVHVSCSYIYIYMYMHTEVISYIIIIICSNNIEWYTTSLYILQTSFLFEAVHTVRLDHAASPRASTWQCHRLRLHRWALVEVLPGPWVDG